MQQEPTPESPAAIKALIAAVPPALALLAAMQLELFTLLGDGPQDVPALAAALGVAEERLSRLLYAMVAAGLMTLADGRLANTPEAAAFLVKGKPRYMGGVHELLDELWHADLKTAASIRSGVPQALHDFADMPAAETLAFLRGLSANALATGRALAARFDFTGAKSVIDVGGGPGSLLVGLCETNPALRGTLLELPQVIEPARGLVAEQGFAGRIAFEAGDIVAAPPAGRHDAAVLRALVQVLSPGDAERAIRNACAALVPGGTIYIIGGGILDDSRTAPASSVYLNLTFLNLYRGGRAYTQSEHFAWLTACGCVEPQRSTLANGSGLIWARKADEARAMRTR